MQALASSSEVHGSVGEAVVPSRRRPGNSAAEGVHSQLLGSSRIGSLKCDRSCNRGWHIFGSGFGWGLGAVNTFRPIIRYCQVLSSIVSVSQEGFRKLSLRTAITITPTANFQRISQSCPVFFFFPRSGSDDSVIQTPTHSSLRGE